VTQSEKEEKKEKRSRLLKEKAKKKKKKKVEITTFLIGKIPLLSLSPFFETGAPTWCDGGLRSPTP